MRLRVLIILLPKDDGTPSGEILVATAIGEVLLNKPYQATTVSMFGENLLNQLY